MAETRERETVSFSLVRDELALLDEARTQAGGEVSRGQLARFLLLQALRFGTGAHGKGDPSVQTEVGTLSRQILELSSQIEELKTFSRGNAKSAETLNENLLAIGRQLFSAQEALDRVKDDVGDLLGAVAEVLRAES